MPTNKSPEPSEVEAIVNEKIGKHPVLKRLGTQALPGTASHGEYGWSVMVGTKKNPSSTFKFVAELADVTEELFDESGLDVLLAPSTRSLSDDAD